MPKQFYSASEAAKMLGISLDTLRRWDSAGRIETARDSGNHRIVAATEISRLRGDDDQRQLSARNRLNGTVAEVKVDGLMAQVELVVDQPARLVAIVTADAVEELGLRAGMPATAVVKATSVMVEHAGGSLSQPCSPPSWPGPPRPRSRPRGPRSSLPRR
jgi:molybdopterin-binding protein